ncbi:MAG: DUF1854 domain-containing protein [Fimbriimonadaceae bacterium]
MNVDDINLFYWPKDRLRMTLGARQSWHTVKPAWASPLNHPHRFLALLDGKSEEIVMLPDPAALPPSSWEVIQEELNRRYLTAQVERIVDATNEFGATYWHVETDRGERDFVTQSLQENVQWLGLGHLLLTDVDGNRFEIRDVAALDPRSRGLIERIL